jgi:hypothetical protein
MHVAGVRPGVGETIKRLARLTAVAVALGAVLGPAGPVFAQGVTTGSLSGVVTDANAQPVTGASVIAIHVPSGTSYQATTRGDGRFSMPGMRVGGPYSVTVTASAPGASGFQPQTQDDVQVNLGVATDLVFRVPRCRRRWRLSRGRRGATRAHRTAWRGGACGRAWRHR